MDRSVPRFSYAELVSRNLGLVSAAEQAQLRSAAVFVVGLGGMGGAALQSLVRLGIGRVALADGDRFELSNLNRQVFGWVSAVGQGKVEATCAQLRDINPELAIATPGPDWLERLPAILSDYPIVINGMDDYAAGLRLYREAAARGAVVVDAYLSPLPSVTVVRPTDPRPEDRLRFPTAGRPLSAIGPTELGACVRREIEYVLTHSSSASHLDLRVAGEMLAGRRPRPSFAPMVIMTGTLMAFEVVKLVIGRSDTADCRGVFFDPWRMRVEYPRRGPAAWVAGRLARRAMVRLFTTGAAG